MKPLLSLITFVMLFTLTSEAQSPDRKFGAGAVIGEPSGLSVAYWTAPTRSFAAGAAWSFGNDASMHLHLDYLFQQFDIVNVSRGALPLYFGLGGRLRFQNEDNFGIRIPLGAAYHFENDPIEVFIEVVPVIELIPGTDFSGNSGIGLRYYF